MVKVLLYLNNLVELILSIFKLLLICLQLNVFVEGQQRNQYAEHVTPWISAFSIVIFIVVLLIAGGFLLFW